MFCCKNLAPVYLKVLKEDSSEYGKKKKARKQLIVCVPSDYFASFNSAFIKALQVRTFYLLYH